MNNIYQTVVKSSVGISHGILKLNSQSATALGLSDRAVTSLHFGKNRVRIIISINDNGKNKNTIRLSSQDMKKLRLHSESCCAVCFRGDGIHLGPVVGIMAETSNRTGNPFGGQSFFIKQLIKAGHEMGMVCFGFNSDDINWENKTINGYVYTPDKWIKLLFPFPDIVYPRELGCSRSKLRLRKRMEALGCQFLNPPLLNKWQIFKILSIHPVLKDHLPETRLVTNFHVVELMLNHYHSVYLKPVNGSRGHNIIRIRKKSRLASAYQYKYHKHNQIYGGNSSTLNELKRSIRPVMHERSYIVQNQINLLRLQDNILDVRVMVQKDDSGNFSLTGKACRIGKPGSITSNISTGGYCRKVETILARHFDGVKARETITQEIDRVALEAARALDRAVGGIGELGIDIGIEPNGKTWFIEANLRPARQVFTLIGEPELRWDSIIKPLLYCRYLAGFETQ